jgi:Mg2+/citrate symporter
MDDDDGAAAPDDVKIIIIIIIIIMGAKFVSACLWEQPAARAFSNVHILPGWIYLPMIRISSNRCCLYWTFSLVITFI